MNAKFTKLIWRFQIIHIRSSIMSGQWVGLLGLIISQWTVTTHTSETDELRGCTRSVHQSTTMLLAKNHELQLGWTRSDDGDDTMAIHSVTHKIYVIIPVVATKPKHQPTHVMAQGLKIIKFNFTSVSRIRKLIMVYKRRMLLARL